MKTKTTYNMKKKSNLYRNGSKKWLAFLFSIVMLFTGFSARANFSNGIFGLNNAITGTESTEVLYIKDFPKGFYILQAIERVFR
jgi:hypothetical protein